MEPKRQNQNRYETKNKKYKREKLSNYVKIVLEISLNWISYLETEIFES